MFGWLKGKVESAAAKSVDEDLSDYIRRLEGMSNEEIGKLLYNAYIAKTIFDESNLIPIRLFSLVDERAERDRFVAISGLKRVIGQFQVSKQFGAAAGALVWIQSLRSLAYPSNRSSGRLIWAHLLRGYGTCWQMLDRYREQSNDPIFNSHSVDEIMIFPASLIPEKHALPHHLQIRIWKAIREKKEGGHIIFNKELQDFLLKPDDL